MRWRLVIELHDKSFGNCCSTKLAFRSRGYGLTYRLIMCSSKIYCFKICTYFYIHENKM